MKLKIFIMILLGFMIYCKEKTVTPTKDTNTFAYVNTQSGLVLRKEEKQESEQVDLIPFGTKLEFSGTIAGPEQLENISGAWIEFSYNGKKGYIFTGYLSFVDPKKTIQEEWNCIKFTNLLQGGYSSTQYYLFADGTYVSTFTSAGDFAVIQESGTYAKKDAELQLPGQTFLYVGKYLVEPKDKPRLEKEPNIAERLMNNNSEEDESKAESIYLCEKPEPVK